jgi:hypothetical protein
MIETIQLRIAGPLAHRLVSRYSPRPIGSSTVSQIGTEVYEVSVPSTSRLISSLLQARASKSYKTSDWFVSFYEIRRTYTEQELLAAELLHLRPLRVFIENMTSLDHLDLADVGHQKLPISQLQPIVLNGRIRCKDELIALPEGSWLCSPAFATALKERDDTEVYFLPTFSSVAERSIWISKRTLQKGSIRVSDLELGSSEFDEWTWLQLVPPIGPYVISEPTDCTILFETPNDKITDYPGIYCERLRSELYVKVNSNDSRSWGFTRNFIGSAAGFYLPTRELLVKSDWLRFLRQFRMHNVEIDRTFRVT